jgi:hypothetical protein
MLETLRRPRLRNVVALVGALLVGTGGSGALYGQSHCAPWERVLSDQELATQALGCSLFDGDYSGAEGHIDAIDDRAYRAEIDSAVDNAEAVAGVNIVSNGGEVEDANKILKLVEDKDVKQWAEGFIVRFQSGEVNVFSDEPADRYREPYYLYLDLRAAN